MTSELENIFNLQLMAYKITGYEREYKFHPSRRFRFDYAWPAQMIAVELQGGVWGKKSGHNSGTGIIAEMEKSNQAQMLGWQVYKFFVDQVKSGEAIQFMQSILSMPRQ
jgi:hypothetical protein